MDEQCLVESCGSKSAPGKDFCKSHAERIHKASKAAGTGPDWMSKMEKMLSDDEMVAWGTVITRMMQADASAVKTFGEPVHVTPEEWDAKAAEGWKTTDHEKDDET